MLPDHGVPKDVNAKMMSIVKSFNSLLLHASGSEDLRKGTLFQRRLIFPAGAVGLRRRIHGLRDLEAKIRASLMAEYCTFE
jgi:hypothetical protein